MASERQIAANRRNARRSIGPRSSAGKKRSSHDAYSHGLTLNISSAAFAKQVEKSARKIAGGSKDEIILEHARAAAQAEFDLARVRQVKLALIERVSALGAQPRRFLALWPKKWGILDRFCWAERHPSS